jgi:DMSO/TMAO reductase YedYZ molybdopterin-dependent catalytic subunit
MRSIPVLILILVSILLSAGCTSEQVASVPAEFANWTLTLNGNISRMLTMNEVLSLPTVTGHGYSVSTVGIRNGPHICKGVDLRDLAELVGGINPSQEIWVSAPDGYLWVFDYHQLQGEGFIAMNEDLQEIPSPPLRVLLMYEQDGHFLTYDEGGPLRIAIISEEEEVVTEGSAWVKWVDNIEVHGH